MMIDQPKKRPPGKLVYNRVGEQCLSEKRCSETIENSCILEEIKNRVLGSPIPSSSEVSIS
jgi:hypothetical protein